jgi:ADP-ribose pyrophosphatase
MPLKKWKLLSSKDISPSRWFPIEERTYELSNGTIVDDFTITTLSDVAMIVPVTPDEKIVLVRQYKPGFNDILLEFPAGRIEKKHQDIKETALHELEEETGIRTESLEFIGLFSGFVTKATEKVYCYLASNVEFNSNQNLDPTEEIEVVTLTYSEVEELITQNQLPTAITVAAWDLVKRRFSDRFPTWHS